MIRRSFLGSLITPFLVPKLAAPTVKSLFNGQRSGPNNTVTLPMPDPWSIHWGLDIPEYCPDDLFSRFQPFPVHQHGRLDAVEMDVFPAGKYEITITNGPAYYPYAFRFTASASSELVSHYECCCYDPRVTIAPGDFLHVNIVQLPHNFRKFHLVTWWK